MKKATLFLFITLMYFTAFAEGDYVDDGYVDDNEPVVEETIVPKVETPAEKSPVVQKSPEVEKPVQTTRKKIVFTKKTTKVATVPKEESGTSGLLIGGSIGILVIGLGLLLFALKKRGCGGCGTCENSTCENSSASSSDTQETITPKAPTPLREAPKTFSAQSLTNMDEATKVDSMGRNPSGIIIDEDTYFSQGSTEFVDEDFVKEEEQV